MNIDTLFIIFFGAICLDFVTGIIAAAKEGKLKSRTCSSGLFRSIGECIVLFIGVFAVRLMPEVASITSFFITGFIFKEGLSVIENLIKLDVWIPLSLKKMLEVGVDKIENNNK